MQINLSREELTKLLRQATGLDADFTCFYTETDDEWENRTGEKISELIHPQEKKQMRLHFN